jgi:uncharacterized protein with PIN domain
MIVVDSSALVAIFEGEPDAAAFAQAIAIADRLLISAVNVFETGIVLRVRHGNAAPARLWRFFEENGFEIVPFDELQAREAHAAFDRFGKRHRFQSASQPCRLRGLRSRQVDEPAAAVQGRRLPAYRCVSLQKNYCSRLTTSAQDTARRPTDAQLFFKERSAL